MSNPDKSMSMSDKYTFKSTVLSGTSDVNVPALRRTFEDMPLLLGAAAPIACADRGLVPRPPCEGRVDPCDFWAAEDTNLSRCTKKYLSPRSRNRCIDAARADFFQSWCDDRMESSSSTRATPTVPSTTVSEPDGSSVTPVTTEPAEPADASVEDPLGKLVVLYAFVKVFLILLFFFFR